MIVIIDYGLGNLTSVKNALDKLKIPTEISGDPHMFKKAKALILPGVGAAGQGMENLKNRGMDKVIIEQAKRGTPILGICLGMQLLFTSSEEGNVDCLNLVRGTVKKFRTTLKVPHVGWNNIKVQSSKFKVQNIFKNIPEKSYFYFVHGYYCKPKEKQTIIATTDYDGDFGSIVKQDNITGVQFHPEKSGEVGLQLLKNFWEAVC